MSQKYPGGFITKSPVAPTSTAASGIWTLDQQQQAQKAGSWPSPPIFIEDLFSTYLYTGTDAAVTINNGIDLSTKGGMIWWKSRSGVSSNLVQDTTRGITKVLRTNTTDAETTETDYVTSVSTTGFSVGASLSVSPTTYATWTFRKQPKFFDIVTYSGSNSTQTISHNLGSAPGCIIIKKLDSNTFNAGWAVYHRSLTNPNNYYLVLNSTAAETNYGAAFISSVSSTTFTVAGNAGEISLAGSTYVAYLFAHNAGGFGLTGTDNVITCGSFTADGSGGVTVNLGFEPQWIMYKSATRVINWTITDNMRGWFPQSTVNPRLAPNSSNAESTSNDQGILSTGFNSLNNFSAGETVIYVAIRRGPMKTPTVGTSVFKPTAYAGAEPTPQYFATGFTVDMNWYKYRDLDIGTSAWSRLTSGSLGLVTSSTNAEVNITSDSGSQILRTQFQRNDGFSVGTGAQNAGGTQSITYSFQRAPGFFDVVAYTGTGSTRTVTHNLGVVPEFIIVKTRNSGVYDWNSYHVSLGNTQYIALNTTAAVSSAVSLWNNTTPTSTVFTVNHPAVNDSGGTYVAYLFTTLTGISKVGSYTGTGALQTVNCGFTSGARFVLIKRSDSTGDWWTYDSARGITSGNDPYFFINSTAVEATGTNYVDTDTTGFKVTAAAPAGLNANGGTYIFLAIA